jgi:hypothetical protein
MRCGSYVRQAQIVSMYALLQGKMVVSKMISGSPEISVGCCQSLHLSFLREISTHERVAY